MATQLDIKRRIRSVKNTQQITRAMKFVAAARLRRAQEKAVCGAALRARAYAPGAFGGAARAGKHAIRCCSGGPEKRILLLAVSGERGLVRRVQCQRDSAHASNFCASVRQQKPAT